MQSIYRMGTSSMKIAVAQLQPQVGPVEQNIDAHLCLIELAASQGASLIVFPELSLTGYEPRRAAELSRSNDDPCFAKLQQLSKRLDISAGVGFPLRTANLPQIASLQLSPRGPARVYSKAYLHPDELPSFQAGDFGDPIIFNQPPIALAICYELSVPDHAKWAFSRGASIYLASVAKSEAGMETASQRLIEIAKQYSAFALAANCFGDFDETDCCGQSAVFNRKGDVLCRMGRSETGVIVLDTAIEKAIAVLES